MLIYLGIMEVAPNLHIVYIHAGPPTYIHRDKLFPYLQNFTTQIEPSDYDIVFTNYWLSGYVGLQTGLPHVHTHHSLGKIKYGSMSQDLWPGIAPIRLAMEKQLNHACDLIFNLNKAEKQLTKQRKSIIAPIGINVELFTKYNSKMSAKRQLGFSTDVVQILYVGRFAEQKGVMYALEAMKKPILPIR